LIAVFASKIFRVSVSSKNIYTFDGFNVSGGLQTEKQEVEGKKPKTYIKGIDLHSMQFNMSLKTSLGVDVRLEYESWVTIKDAKMPHLFILGGKPLWINKWLLISVGLTDTVINSDGVIIEGKLSLQFEEYDSAGSKKSDSQTAKPAVASTGTNSVLVEKLVGNKAAEKRVNIAMQRAIAKGLDVG
jgi:hypothetical protein